MSATSSEPRSEFRVRGAHVLLGVVAFFAVIICVDATFTVLALRTFPGQVSVTPYEDGLIYNRRLAQLKAQDRLGWRAVVAETPGEVMLTYSDRNGDPVTGLTVTGRLERPATETGRIQLKFVERSPGRYAASTGALSGAWDITAEAHGAGDTTFIAERRLAWP